jgi:tRNA (guanine9-N1)-methyltransferase
VIGGIVDHNRLKNITYDFAKNNKIEVKRLPFNNIKLKTNVHLAVNHVWEWMLRRYNG